MLTKAAFIG